MTIMDLEAKFRFVVHCRHNADYCCTQFFQKGERESFIKKSKNWEREFRWIKQFNWDWKYK